MTITEKTISSRLEQVEELIAARTIAIENWELLKATNRIPFDSVLDIGFGRGSASLFFALNGKQVDAISVGEQWIRQCEPILERVGIQPRYCSLEKYETENRYDAIWMSHILEHTCNPGYLLQKAASLLRPDGWLMICVPPFKHEVVRGHVSVGWNVGTLMYNLLVNGFNIKKGHFIKHGYNVCSFVQKSEDLCNRFHGKVAEELKSSIFGKNTAACWPPAIVRIMNEFQHFNGDIRGCNWISKFDEIQRNPGIIKTAVSDELLDDMHQLLSSAS